MRNERYFNVLLRTSSIGSKFLLLQQIAVTLSPAVVAEYALLQSFLAFAIILSGLNIYNITNRELAKNMMVYHPNELLAYGVGYLISIIIYVYAFFDYVQVTVVLVIFILAGEHLAQEYFRKLVIIGCQIPASFLIFLKGASWSLPLYVCSVFGFITLDLSIVLWAWCAGLLISIVTSRILIIKYLPNLNSVKLNQQVIFEKFFWYTKKAFPYLVVALFSRLPMVFDKLLVAYGGPKSEVALYSVMSSFTFFIVSVFDALIGSYTLAKMVSTSLDKNQTIKAAILFVKQVMSLYLLSGLIIYAAVFQLEILGEFYSQREDVFFILFIASFTLSLSQFPHFYLYSNGFDRLVNMVSIVGPFVFFLGVSHYYIFDVTYTMANVAILVVLSYCAVFLVRWLVFYYKLSEVK